MFPGILDFDPQFVNFGVSSLTAASGKVCRKGLGSERCGLWKRMSVNLLERRVWGRGFEEGGCLKFGREKSTCLLGANLGVQRGWQRRRITANSPVPSSWGMSRTGLKRSIHLAIAKGKGDGAETSCFVWSVCWGSCISELLYYFLSASLCGLT